MNGDVRDRLNRLQAAALTHNLERNEKTLRSAITLLSEQNFQLARANAIEAFCICIGAHVELTEKVKYLNEMVEVLTNRFGEQEVGQFLTRRLRRLAASMSRQLAQPELSMLERLSVDRKELMKEQEPNAALAMEFKALLERSPWNRQWNAECKRAAEQIENDRTEEMRGKPIALTEIIQKLVESATNGGFGGTA